MSRFDLDVGFDIGIKGRLILFGFVLMAAAAIGDAVVAPDTFSVLFAVGAIAAVVGVILIIVRGYD
ncbi:MAG: hypothetical protein AB1351_13275 [Thermoproteota archaeon]